MRVRPSERKPHTSRSSSSFVKTRYGSAASFTSSSYSLPARSTRAPATVDAAGRELDRDRARLQPLELGGLRTAQHGVHPRDELVVDERPRDEVVAAARERPHAVDRVRLLAADDDHRDAVERVERRRVAEEDEIGMRARGELERGVAIVGADDVEAVLREVPLEKAPDSGLRLCDQHRGHARDANAPRDAMSVAPHRQRRMHSRAVESWPRATSPEMGHSARARIGCIRKITPFGRCCATPAPPTFRRASSCGAVLRRRKGGRTLTRGKLTLVKGSATC